MDDVISGTTAAEIADSVRGLRERGMLRPGDALPPVRELAATLGVNRNTAVAAYRQLAQAGLVIARGRAGTVVAGADVREFGQVASPEEAVPFIRAAHAILARLEALPFPTVAAITGYCLGGGLELAIACRHRVCVDDPKAVLGYAPKDAAE